MLAAVPGVVIGVLVLVVVGVAVGWPVAAGPALAAGVVVGIATWWRAPAAILRSLGARPADEDHWPRPFGIVDGLCATMGLSPPDLWLVEDESANAMAVGTRPGSSVLVVTTGLVQRLDPVQLEGVLAHELTHMKHGDVAVGTVAAAVVLPLAGMIDPGGVVHHLRGRGTELLTDRRAVGVTRYPPALRSALAIMVGSGSEPAAAAVAGPHRPPSSEPAGTAHPGAAHASSSDGVGTAPGGASGLAATAAGRATRWLWTVALGPSPQGPALTGELDAPEVRMAALDEL